MSEWLVLHLNKKWELQIPVDLRTWRLSSLLNERVAMIMHEGSSSRVVNNRRVRNPSILFLDLNTPRKEKLHYNATFLPPWSNLEWILDQEKYTFVWENWILVLPKDIQTLFGGTTRRARMLLLQRPKWGIIDGFALSFQPKFLAGSDWRTQ